MAELLYKDLTEKIIKVFLEVYNHLGYGYKKEVYMEALAIEMTYQGLSYEKNKSMKIFYKENVIGEYKLDFVNEEKVILFVDTSERILPQTESEIMNELRTSKFEIGLVLNFGRKPEVKRKIYQIYKKKEKPKLKEEFLDESRN